MSEHEAKGRRRAGQVSVASRVLVAVTFLIVGLVTFEVACRIYAWARVDPHFARMLDSPRLYLRESENPVLGYELMPGAERGTAERVLEINDHGIRDDSDGLFPDKYRIAMLGDSATLGVSHSQQNTVSGRLQARLDPAGERTKVFNFGVGGYSVEEIDENLRVKDAIYDVDEVVYLMHMNDFARRHSIYEGADNGSYRMFNRPSFYGPWFLRKAVYRYKKAEQTGGSVGWYLWMFEGNEERGRHHIRAMSKYAAEQGARFSVLLMPSGLAYSDGEYGLADMNERISTFLREEGIPFVSPVEEFSQGTDGLIDNTEHFTLAGNELLAELVAELIGQPARGTSIE